MKLILMLVLLFLLACSNSQETQSSMSSENFEKPLFKPGIPGGGGTASGDIVVDDGPMGTTQLPYKNNSSHRLSLYSNTNGQFIQYFYPGTTILLRGLTITSTNVEVYANPVYVAPTLGNPGSGGYAYEVINYLQ